MYNVACPLKLLSAAVLSVASLVAGPTIVRAEPSMVEIQSSSLTYQDGQTELRGFKAAPAEATGLPGILVVPEWWGVNEYTEYRAKKLAELGYSVLVADVYGTGTNTTDPKRAKELSQPFYNDRALFRRRLQIAMATLASQNSTDRSRLAVLGYCFGGTGSLELARSGELVRAVVSFHGGLSNPNPQDAKNIKGEVLILNGDADTFVSEEERSAFKKEMNAAKIPYTFVDFSGAVHAFTNPKADLFKIPGIAYNERADKESWEMMKSLLARTLEPTKGN